MRFVPILQIPLWRTSFFSWVVWTMFLRDPPTVWHPSDSMSHTTYLGSLVSFCWTYFDFAYFIPLISTLRCCTVLRIDWQVFLDAPIEQTDKLLDVLCYTEPVFTPNHLVSDGVPISGHEQDVASTTENREPGITGVIMIIYYSVYLQQQHQRSH